MGCLFRRIIPGLYSRLKSPCDSHSERMAQSVCFTSITPCVSRSDTLFSESTESIRHRIEGPELVCGPRFTHCASMATSVVESASSDPHCPGSIRMPLPAIRISALAALPFVARCCSLMLSLGRSTGWPHFKLSWSTSSSQDSMVLPSYEASEWFQRSTTPPCLSGSSHWRSRTALTRSNLTTLSTMCSHRKHLGRSHFALRLSCEYEGH